MNNQDILSEHQRVIQRQINNSTGNIPIKISIHYFHVPLLRSRTFVKSATVVFHGSKSGGIIGGSQGSRVGSLIPVHVHQLEPLFRFQVVNGIIVGFVIVHFKGYRLAGVFLFVVVIVVIVTVVVVESFVGRFGQVGIMIGSDITLEREQGHVTGHTNFDLFLRWNHDHGRMAFVFVVFVVVEIHFQSDIFGRGWQQFALLVGSATTVGKTSIRTGTTTTTVTVTVSSFQNDFHGFRTRRWWLSKKIVGPVIGRQIEFFALDGFQVLPETLFKNGIQIGQIAAFQRVVTPVEGNVLTPMARVHSIIVSVVQHETAIAVQGLVGLLLWLWPLWFRGFDGCHHPQIAEAKGLVAIVTCQGLLDPTVHGSLGRTDGRSTLEPLPGSGAKDNFGLFVVGVVGSGGGGGGCHARQRRRIGRRQRSGRTGTGFVVAFGSCRRRRCHSIGNIGIIIGRDLLENRLQQFLGARVLLVQRLRQCGNGRLLPGNGAFLSLHFGRELAEILHQEGHREGQQDGPRKRQALLLLPLLALALLLLLLLFALDLHPAGQNRFQESLLLLLLGRFFRWLLLLLRLFFGLACSRVVGQRPQGGGTFTLAAAVFSKEKGRRREGRVRIAQTVFVVLGGFHGTQVTISQAGSPGFQDGHIGMLLAAAIVANVQAFLQ